MKENGDKSMLNIKEHPDFRTEKIEYFCRDCEKATEHLMYLRHKTAENENEPSHVILCRTCALDNAFTD